MGQHLLLCRDKKFILGSGDKETFVREKGKYRADQGYSLTNALMFYF